MGIDELGVYIFFAAFAGLLATKVVKMCEEAQKRREINVPLMGGLIVWAILVGISVPHLLQEQTFQDKIFHVEGPIGQGFKTFENATEIIVDGNFSDYVTIRVYNVSDEKQGCFITLMRYGVEWDEGDKYGYNSPHISSSRIIGPKYFADYTFRLPRPSGVENVEIYVNGMATGKYFIVKRGV